MRTSKRSAVLALVLLGAVVAAPVAASARSAAANAGIGLGCVFGNFIYGPTKMMYAFFGGFIGAIAYGLSAGDNEVAMKVIEPAWRGDYALTIEHLTGKQDLEFIGRRASHSAVREGSAPDAGGSTGGDW